MASGGKLKTITFSPPDSAPQYVRDALKDIGLQEWVLNSKRQHVSNPVVERYIEKVSGSPANAMETPWCAYFVGAKLEYAGITSSKSGMARSYLKWGQALDKDDETNWKCGDIVVFMRGSHDDHVLGHVAFLLRWNDEQVWVVGGNQGDKVCIEAFDRHRILGVRRPRALLASKTVLSSIGSGAAQVTSKAVDAAIPNAGGAPEALASLPTVSPTTGKIPSPDDLQAAYDAAHPYLSMMTKIKPELLAVLTLLSISLALYAGWFRYLDWKKGRT